jgi:nucleoside-diphosphate-sugar epimerase
VEALLAQATRSAALVRDTLRLGWISGLPSVTIAQGSMDEPRSLLEGMRGVDQVYHVAGLTRARGTREFFRVNGEGTRHLVNACLETPRGPRRLVHLSSLAAVGPMPMATACAEDVSPRPVSPYGWSKLQGEAAVLGVRDRLHVTVLRPPRRVRSPRPRRLGVRPLGGTGSPAHACRSIADSQPVLRSGSGDCPSDSGRGQGPLW